MTTPSLRSRILLVDLLKAVAAQFIVLHHLAWYGPLSDQAVTLSPLFASIDSWLAEYGRYAVAVFFVTGGFLAAQTLSSRGLNPANAPGCLIRDRYLRLVLPFAVAMLLAIAASTLARQWMTHDSIGSPPGFLQLLAHLMLLHGLLGIESLSAGIWYVAIDFQLYALLVLLLWLGGCRPASAEFSRAIPVLLLALTSLFYFNRDARWDATGLYFFGAYALGIGSGWAIRSSRRKQLLWLIAIAGGAALLIDFRPRIAIAVATALALGCTRLHMTRFEMKPLHYFGGTSYALFLVHFPVCLLINAGLQHFAPADPVLSAWGLLVAWLASNLVADLFHRYVELPLARWQKRRMQCRARQQAPTLKTPFKSA
ncbi:MAG: acyltransferase family protein [Rhodocyclaceae bacterium]|nr:acyltransferase family protein [Rhodocyclaceae bacterium]